MVTKKLSILVVVFIVALVFWVALEPWVEGPVKFARVEAWLGPLIMLMVLAAVAALGLLLIRDILYRIVLSLLIGVAFLIVFDFNPLYPGTFSILLLSHLYAGKLLAEESTQRTKINTRVILRRSLPWVVLPILIIISFAFYLDPDVQAAAQRNELPPTIKQIIEQTVTRFLGSELDQLPPAERQKAESQLVDQVIDQLTQLTKPYFKYAPPILAFGLFLILQGLSFIFVWLAVWLGMLIFWVLKKTGFVKIVEKEVRAETLALDE